MGLKYLTFSGKEVGNGMSDNILTHSTHFEILHSD